MFGSFSGAKGSEDDDPMGGYPAYAKGYRDGQSGKRFEPISDPTSGGGSSSSSGGFGISKLFSLLMVGSMVMQMAGRPPSVENLMANARNMGPMQIMILMNVLSSLF